MTRQKMKTEQIEKAVFRAIRVVKPMWLTYNEIRYAVPQDLVPITAQGKAAILNALRELTAAGQLKKKLRDEKPLWGLNT